MQRGLEGRRIALAGGSKDARLDAVRSVLEGAGATVQVLSASGADDDWHGAKYAALVLIESDASEHSDPRLLQLVREFLVSDKPLAAYGSAVRAVFEAGGVEGRTVTADGALKIDVERVGAKCVDEDIHVDEALMTARGSVGIEAFASRLVQELSGRLEERAVDEMSELSFPASDPPAVSPSTIGHLKGDDAPAS